MTFGFDELGQAEFIDIEEVAPLYFKIGEFTASLSVTDSVEKPLRLCLELDLDILGAERLLNLLQNLKQDRYSFQEN